eukprot:TRINITY_DN19432_c0_g1_i1.p1 TRINITY_DN19432_c0_g1~~TRINITY_DN19432_c0_g1_i1.p1  ORF type:complete len:222 (+),score=37.94 TRINITY_DN19432_c0_g1_i1:37-702(+)
MLAGLTRTSLFNPRSTSRGSRNAHADSQGATLPKVYELRTYDVHPAHFPSFVKLTQDHIDKRTKYSKLVGYWTSDVSSSINETVHIWEYDSLDHRADVRKQLITDTEWQNEYMAKMRPMLQRQQNQILQMPQGMQLQSPHDGGNLYELEVYKTAAGYPLKSLHQANGIAGLWVSSDIGPSNEIFVLKHFKNFAERSKQGLILTIPKETSKILSPLSFSPLK